MPCSFDAIRRLTHRGHVDVHPIAASRRLLLAVLAVGIAGFAFRGYVAAGLVNRGDDLLRSGEPNQAVRYYERAMFFDSSWETPVDRLGFAATMSGNVKALRAGVAITSHYLESHPQGELARWDRAMCYLHLGRRSDGFADMKVLARESAAHHEIDAVRYADISYNLAMHLGHPGEAREFAQLRNAR